MFYGWKIDSDLYLMWTPALPGIWRMSLDEFKKAIGAS